MFGFGKRIEGITINVPMLNASLTLTRDAIFPKVNTLANLHKFRGNAQTPSNHPNVALPELTPCGGVCYLSLWCRLPEGIWRMNS